MFITYIVTQLTLITGKNGKRFSVFNVNCSETKTNFRRIATDKTIRVIRAII